METVVTLDDKGRITIPKEFRASLGIRKKVRIRREGSRLVIEPADPVSLRFYGVFRAEVPEDLDGLIVEAMASWWRRSRTWT